MVQKSGAVPHNDDAERAVLGAMVAESRLVSEIATKVTGAMFYDSRHQAIFNAAFQLQDRTDLVSVTDALRTAGKLQDIGETYVAGLVTSLVSPENWEYHSEIVRRCYLQRSMMAIGKQIGELAQNVQSEDEMHQAIGQADTLLETMRTLAPASSRVIRVGDDLGDTISGYEAAATAIEGRPLSYGIPELDEALGGQYPGQMIVLAGPTKIGKSSWTAQLWELAARTRGPALLLSNEMLTTDTRDRLFQTHTGIPLTRIRSGSLSDDDWHAITNAAAELHPWPLYSRDNVKTLGQVWDAVTQVREREKRIAWVGVDWLQRMEAPEIRGEDRGVEALDRILNGLKELALRCEIPVVVVSQYRRTKDSYTIHDIRGTGMAEILADAVIQIERVRSRLTYDPRIGWGVKIKVGAARHGVAVECKMWFDAQRLTFVRPTDRVPDEDETPPPPQEAFPA